jgi:hypothetical protein
VLAGLLPVAVVMVLAGCAESDKPVEPAEPGAVQKTHRGEIDGRHDGTDLDSITAQRWVDRVHVGRTVNPSGKIEEADRADVFRPGESVYLSMEVTDAPAGSAVQVSVVDAETENQLWSDTKQVEAGRSHLVFQIDPAKLGSGEYRAEVYVGDERVARREFEINV